ncbi:hypothetical protein OHA21_09990 [Actinoplanes sp. NBC_00393]|uniref:hypothetical protein n=1 Tax=Actinoplanes sp. NBC_00393 TaxID=2975953 RepID=UPI002E1B7F9C
MRRRPGDPVQAGHRPVLQAHLQSGPLRLVDGVQPPPAVVDLGDTREQAVREAGVGPDQAVRGGDRVPVGVVAGHVRLGGGQPGERVRRAELDDEVGEIRAVRHGPVPGQESHGDGDERCFGPDPYGLRVLRSEDQLSCRDAGQDSAGEQRGHLPGTPRDDHGRGAEQQAGDLASGRPGNEAGHVPGGDYQPARGALDASPGRR